MKRLFRFECLPGNVGAYGMAWFIVLTGPCALKEKNKYRYTYTKVRSVYNISNCEYLSTALIKYEFYVIVTSIIIVRPHSRHCVGCIHRIQFIQSFENSKSSTKFCMASVCYSNTYLHCIAVFICIASPESCNKHVRVICKYKCR